MDEVFGLSCRIRKYNSPLASGNQQQKKKKKKTCVDWGKAQREKMNKYNSLSSGKIES